VSQCARYYYIIRRCVAQHSWTFRVLRLLLLLLLSNYSRGPAHEKFGFTWPVYECVQCVHCCATRRTAEDARGGRPVADNRFALCRRGIYRPTRWFSETGRRFGWVQQKKIKSKTTNRVIIKKYIRIEKPKWKVNPAKRLLYYIIFEDIFL